MIIDGNKLIADDGKSLTNGQLYSKLVYLGLRDSPENWQEINDENVPEPEDEATAEDYKSALHELGADV